MTYPNPPSLGDANWGTELNDYLVNTIQAGLSNTTTAFGSHISAAPVTATASDPHGDRAYAQMLIAAYSQNVNAASGFLQLNASGALPYANWTDLRPVATAFSATGSQTLLPPQYLADMSGRVWLAGHFFIEQATYNGQRVFVNSLPAAVRPNKPVSLPVSVLAAGTSASLQTPVITIGNDGSVTLNGAPAGLAAGTPVGIFSSYPLDAYYSLIQE